MISAAAAADADQQSDAEARLFAGYTVRPPQKIPRNLIIMILMFEFYLYSYFLWVVIRPPQPFPPADVSVDVIVVTNCYLHATCAPPTANWQRVKQTVTVSNGTLFVDGTNTLRCDVDICIPASRQNPLTIRAVDSVLVLSDISPTNVVNYDITIVNDPRHQTANNKLYIEGVQFTGLLFVNFTRAIVALTDVVTANGHIVLGWGPFIYASFFNTASFKIAGAVQNSSYCVHPKATTKLFSPCTGVNSTLCPIYVAYQSTAAGAPTSYLSFNATSFYLNDHQAYFSPEGYAIKNPQNTRIAGAGMFSAPSLDPYVIQSLQNTAEWAAQSTIADYVQAIEIVTPTIGMIFLHASSNILTTIGPEWITFFSAYALRPNYRHFYTPLSHYQCPTNEARLFVAPESLTDLILQPGDQTYYSAAVMRQFLESWVSEQTIATLADAISAAVPPTPRDVIVFTAPEYEWVNPSLAQVNRWLLYQVVRLGDGTVEIVQQAFDPLAAGIIIISGVTSLVLAVAIVAVLFIFRKPIAVSYMMIEDRALQRSAFSVTENCPYHYYFSILSMSSWFAFRTAKYLHDHALAKLQSPPIVRFLNYYYKPTDVKENDDSSRALDRVQGSLSVEVLMKRYAEWSLLRYHRDLTPQDELLELVDQFGGRRSHAPKLVVQGLRPKKGAGVAHFTLEYATIEQLYDVTGVASDTVFFDEIFLRAFIADNTVKSDVVLRKLTQWRLQIAEINVEIVQGIKPLQVSDAALLTESACHTITEELEAANSSLPSWGQVEDATSGPQITKTRIAARLVWIFIESVLVTTATLIPYVLAYIITLPLDLEHSRYSTTTAILQVSELQYAATDISAPRPANLLTSVILAAGALFLLCTLVEPFLVLLTFRHVSSLEKGWKNVGPFWTVLILLRIFITGLALALYVFAILGLIWYGSTVAIWWVLGAIIAPARMLVYATSIVTFFVVMLRQYQHLMGLREAVVRHVEATILNTLLKVIRQSPVGDSMAKVVKRAEASLGFQVGGTAGSDAKQQAVTPALLLDACSNDPEVAEKAVEQLSVALSMPVEVVMLAVATIHHRPKYLEKALQGACVAIKLPPVVHPVCIQLALTSLGLPSSPADLAHAMYRLTPPNEAVLHRYDDAIIPIVQALLSQNPNSLNKDAIVSAVVVSLTSTLSRQFEIPAALLTQAYNFAEALYHDNPQRALGEARKVIMGVKRRVPPEMVELRTIFDVFTEGLSLATNQPHMLPRAVVDLVHVTTLSEMLPVKILMSIVEGDSDVTSSSDNAAGAGPINDKTEPIVIAQQLCKQVLGIVQLKLQLTTAQMNTMQTFVDLVKGNAGALEDLRRNLEFAVTGDTGVLLDAVELVSHYRRRGAYIAQLERIATRKLIDMAGQRKVLDPDNLGANVQLYIEVDLQCLDELRRPWTDAGVVSKRDKFHATMRMALDSFQVNTSAAPSPSMATMAKARSESSLFLPLPVDQTRRLSARDFNALKSDVPVYVCLSLELRSGKRSSKTVILRLADSEYNDEQLDVLRYFADTFVDLDTDERKPLQHYDEVTAQLAVAATTEVDWVRDWIVDQWAAITSLTELRFELPPSRCDYARLANRFGVPAPALTLFRDTISFVMQFVRQLIPRAVLGGLVRLQEQLMIELEHAEDPLEGFIAFFQREAARSSLRQSAAGPKLASSFDWQSVLQYFGTVTDIIRHLLREFNLEDANAISQGQMISAYIQEQLGMDEDVFAGHGSNVLTSPSQWSSRNHATADGVEVQVGSPSKKKLKLHDMTTLRFDIFFSFTLEDYIKKLDTTTFVGHNDMSLRVDHALAATLTQRKDAQIQQFISFLSPGVTATLNQIKRNSARRDNFFLNDFDSQIVTEVASIAGQLFQYCCIGRCDVPSLIGDVKEICTVLVRGHKLADVPGLDALKDSVQLELVQLMLDRAIQPDATDPVALSNMTAITDKAARIILKGEEALVELGNEAELLSTVVGTLVRKRDDHVHKLLTRDASFHQSLVALLRYSGVRKDQFESAKALLLSVASAEHRIRSAQLRFAGLQDLVDDATGTSTLNRLRNLLLDTLCRRRQKREIDLIRALFATCQSEIASQLGLDKTESKSVLPSLLHSDPQGEYERLLKDHFPFGKLRGKQGCCLRCDASKKQKATVIFVKKTCGHEPLCKRCNDALARSRKECAICDVLAMRPFGLMEAECVEGCLHYATLSALWRSVFNDLRSAYEDATSADNVTGANDDAARETRKLEVQQTASRATRDTMLLLAQFCPNMASKVAVRLRSLRKADVVHFLTPEWHVLKQILDEAGSHPVVKLWLAHTGQDALVTARAWMPPEFGGRRGEGALADDKEMDPVHTFTGGEFTRAQRDLYDPDRSFAGIGKEAIDLAFKNVSPFTLLAPDNPAATQMRPFFALLAGVTQWYPPQCRILFGIATVCVQRESTSPAVFELLCSMVPPKNRKIVVATLNLLTQRVDMVDFGALATFTEVPAATLLDVVRVVLPDATPPPNEFDPKPFGYLNLILDLATGNIYSLLRYRELLVVRNVAASTKATGDGADGFDFCRDVLLPLVAHAAVRCATTADLLARHATFQPFLDQAAGTVGDVKVAEPFSALTDFVKGKVTPITPYVPLFLAMMHLSRSEFDPAIAQLDLFIDGQPHTSTDEKNVEKAGVKLIVLGARLLIENGAVNDAQAVVDALAALAVVIKPILVQKGGVSAGQNDRLSYFADRCMPMLDSLVKPALTSAIARAAKGVVAASAAAFNDASTTLHAFPVISRDGTHWSAPAKPAPPTQQDDPGVRFLNNESRWEGAADHLVDDKMSLITDIVTSIGPGELDQNVRIKPPKLNAGAADEVGAESSSTTDDGSDDSDVDETVKKHPASSTLQDEASEKLSQVSRFATSVVRMLIAKPSDFSAFQRMEELSIAMLRQGMTLLDTAMHKSEAPLPDVIDGVIDFLVDLHQLEMEAVKHAMVAVDSASHLRLPPHATAAAASIQKKNGPTIVTATATMAGKAAKAGQHQIIAANGVVESTASQMQSHDDDITAMLLSAKDLTKEMRGILANGVSGPMIVVQLLSFLLAKIPTTDQPSSLSASSDPSQRVLRQGDHAKLAAIVRLSAGDLEAILDIVRFTGLHVSPQNMSQLRRLLQMGQALSRVGKAKGSLTANDVFEIVTEQIFNEFDTNRAGVMTYEDYKSAFSRMQLVTSDAEARKWFNECDVDGTGEITLQQFQSALKRARAHVERRVVAQLGLSNETIYVGLVWLAFFALCLIGFLIMGVYGFADGTQFTAVVTAAMPAVAGIINQVQDPNFMSQMLKRVDVVIANMFHVTDMT